jgi:hypothetical protein
MPAIRLAERRLDDRSVVPANPRGAGGQQHKGSGQASHRPRIIT